MEPALELYEGPLPLRLEEVTPGWLTTALAPRYPGVEVVGFTLAGEIDGTASKVRLALEYNDEGVRRGLPPRAWLKGGFEGRAFGNAPSFVAEARFFVDWAPRLSINMPKAFYCGVDPAGRQGLVLLEDLDLRGATYGWAPSPLTPEQAAQVLDVRAQVHAAYWDSPDIRGLRSYRDRFAGANHWIAEMTAPGVYETWVDTPRFTYVPTELHDPHAYKAAMEALYAFTDEGVQCFNQGDAHLGNVFFEPDGTPGLLDWQAYIRCSGLLDASYFLIGAITIEDRRAHERELLRGYLESLARHGVRHPPGFDEAWLAYRRYALHGFAWTMTTGDFHPEEVIMSYAHRYGAAAGDLETLKALDPSRFR